MGDSLKEMLAKKLAKWIVSDFDFTVGIPTEEEIYDTLIENDIEEG